MYVLPLLSTVVNTEANGERLKAVVLGTTEGSLPGVLLVPAFMLRLDKFILIVPLECKRMNAYVVVGVASALTVPGRAAGSLLETGEVVTVFVFPLPGWAAAEVWCADEVGAACGGNWVFCGGIGGFWVELIAWRVASGGFVATPLVTDMTRPSSKVVIAPLPLGGSRGWRGECGFFRFELWSAESSGVTGDADLPCGCIVVVRLTATAAA